ncbi:MAG: NTP transferase domain-containing protein [Armatimonadetes bacterium]|nr:NTP transferase domain-containing protein [Armatimonadota bacterium]
MPTVVLFETDRLEDELATRAAAPGLLPLGGLPLLSYAARAFRACGDVTRVVLAGSTGYAGHGAALAEVDESLLLDGATGTRLQAVLDQYGGENELLFWPPNAPLVRPEMVEHFLAHAPVQAALTWALVREERMLQIFPDGLDVPRHGFDGLNLAITPLGLVRPAAIETQRPLLNRLVGTELNRGELIKMLGMGFAIKFQARRAPLDEVVRRLSEALSLPCLAQILPFPELAFRVRNRAEHHLARARLESL